MRTGRDKLHGIVEVDETLVGGEDKGGKRGRGAEKKVSLLLLWKSMSLLDMDVSE